MFTFLQIVRAGGLFPHWEIVWRPRPFERPQGLVLRIIADLLILPVALIVIAGVGIAAMSRQISSLIWDWRVSRDVRRYERELRNPGTPVAQAHAIATRVEEEGRFNPLTWRPGDPIPAGIAAHLPCPSYVAGPGMVHSAYTTWARHQALEYLDAEPIGVRAVIGPEGIEYLKLYFKYLSDTNFDVCVTSDAFDLVYVTGDDERKSAVAFNAGGHPLLSLIEKHRLGSSINLGVPSVLRTRYQTCSDFWYHEHLMVTNPLLVRPLLPAAHLH